MKKLSQYAKERSITYRTAWNHYKNNKVKTFVSNTGSIYVYEEKDMININDKVVLYARVSSSENKSNLESQLKRIREFSIAKGYTIYKEIKEVGSGINDNRKQLIDLLSKNEFTKIVVEHKDRLTRFGFNYIQTLLKSQGKEIEIINETNSNKEDLIQDFISIITSYCARIYGLRRSKRKTEKLIKELENDKK